MSVKNHKKSSIFFAFLIFFIALFFRAYNPQWDSGYHLHPDERFLTMVISDIKLPNSLHQYFDSSTSPLNPYNYSNYKFFVYGTFPIFTAKFLSHLLNYDTYDKFLIFGRYFSAIFDSLNILILYLISALIFSDKSRFRHEFFWLNLAGIIYSFTVLPLQLSHFFTVDTFLCFFLLSTFYFLSRYIFSRNNLWLILASFTYGLAFSSKISAILFAPVIIIFLLYYFFHIKKSIQTLIFYLLFAITTLVTFRIFQPYAFNGLASINPQFLDSLKQLNGIVNNRDPYYPPEVQYLDRTPIIYPLTTLILWGFGLPLSLVLITALPQYLLRQRFLFRSFIQLNLPTFILSLMVFWSIFLICYQGLQFTNTVRYFLPIYPYFSLILAYIFFSFPKYKKIYFCLLSLHFIYFFAFFGIYTRPHSRVAASYWIYQNIPTASKITNEVWDDTLPLDIPGHYFSLYQNTQLPLYDPDTVQKWQKLDSEIQSSNYIFLTSNRLWGSISRVPNRYPDSSNFYQSLFQENFDFKRLISFTSYPGFSLPFIKKCIFLGPTNYPGLPVSWLAVDSHCYYPGIYFRDDTAEESFTVYDHPQVIIFAKK